jgi:type VI secretion system secreted protein Hcp
MAGKAYFLLKIEGVDGESPDPEYVGHFEIDNWDFTVYMASTLQTGGGMTMGKAAFTGFSFSKKNDKASPLLSQHCARGTHIGEAKLVARKQGLISGDLEEYATFEFKNLVISRFRAGGSDGAGLPDEMVAFSFEGLNMSYDEKLATGTGAGNMFAGYDAKTQVVS